jgi:hypothetical protein
MSFRYTNYVTSLLKQRILFQKQYERIVRTVYRGQDAGVTVECNAFGRLLNIQVAPQAVARYQTPAGTVAAAPLAAAIRAAVLDANTRVRGDKEEAYRASLDSVIEAREDRTPAWALENATSLRPLPSDGLAEEARLGLVRESTGSPSVVAEWHRAVEGTPAHCLPEYAPALLQLRDPLVVHDKKRQRMADAENQFWRRVDLIRRAQLNVIGPVKRPYASMGKEAPDTEADSVRVSFTR